MIRLKIRSLAATLLVGATTLLTTITPSKAAPGDLDLSFTPALGTSSINRRIATQGDGKILIADDLMLKRFNLDGTQDTSFSCNVSGSNIHTMSVQYDNKIIIGGALSLVNGTSVSRLARLHPDGRLDTSFAPTFNGTVRFVICQSDGKYLVAGAFTLVNGTSKSAVARLNSNGTLDTSFSMPIGGDAYEIFPYLGNIYVCGDLTSTISWAPRVSICSWDGFTLRPGPLVPSGMGLIKTMKFVHDQIYIGGTFQMLDTDPANCISLLDIYMMPISFPYTVAGTEVTSIASGPYGSMIIAGNISSVTDGTSVYSLNNITSLPPSPLLFSASIGTSTSMVKDMAMDINGHLIATGNFSSVNSTPRAGVARIESQGLGTPDISPPVGSAGDSGNIYWHLPHYSLEAIAELSDDGGGNSITHQMSVPHEANQAEFSIPAPMMPKGLLIGKTLSRYTASKGVGMIASAVDYSMVAMGDLDQDYNPNVNQAVYATAQQHDGKIIIGGTFTTVGGVTRNRIARLHTYGFLDTSFNTTANNNVHAISVLPNGKIFIGGTFTQVNGVTSNRLARLNADGTLDTSFSLTVNNEVHALVLQPDGKVLIGGNFTTVGGVTRNRIARLNADGTLDTTFNPNANGFVRSIAVQEDGKIVIGGLFTRVGGTGAGGAVRNYIARVNSNGSLDTTFNPGANAAVLAVAVQSDGKVLMGGEFTTASGAARSYLARVNSNGTLDTAFTTGANNFVFGIGLQSEGKIFVNGQFTLLEGVVRSRCGLLLDDGTVDGTMTTGTDNPAFGALVQANGDYFVTGAFTSFFSPAVGTVARNNAGRVFTDLPYQDLSLSVGATHVQWLRSGSVPDVLAVWFEYSTNGGVTWTNLGAGTRVTGGWARTGITLPSSGILRAVGITRGGRYNGSSGLCQAVKNF